MRVRFWGTRGSIPVSVMSDIIREKLRHALTLALRAGLRDETQVNEFISRLPFAVNGTYGTNTSCVQIDTGGDEYIVCDAGTGIKPLGESVQSRLEPGRTATWHVFLSHLHWDHIQGFPFFAPAYVPGNRIVVYGCHPDLSTVFTTQQAQPFFPVSLEAMPATIEFVQLDAESSYEINGVSVSIHKQMHPGDSFGYRFEADNRRIVYSTDSEHKARLRKPDYPFLDFCQEADLLIFDAQYGFAETQTLKEDWGHSSNILGVELAKDAGVRHLCLFHQEPSFNDWELDAFLKDTRHYERMYRKSILLQISMAYDGLDIDV